MTIFEWLEQRCDEDQIASKDGILYIPIDTVERKLDLLYIKFDVIWNTANYKSNLYMFNGSIWISASIELFLVNGLDNKEIKRVVGCATFPMPHGNHHLDATAKSLAVVNASMDLGDQFGRFLSLQTPAVPAVSDEKPLADFIVMRKYRNAIKSNDLELAASIEKHYKIPEDVE